MNDLTPGQLYAKLVLDYPWITNWAATGPKGKAPAREEGYD